MSLTPVIVLNVLADLGIVALLTAVMRIPFLLDRRSAEAPRPVEIPLDLAA